MVAGRARVVSVRLTGDEFVVWEQAAVRSPFGSVARWCRENVTAAMVEYHRGSRPWAQARVPEVDGAVVEAVRSACAGVNHAAMRSHRTGVLVPELRGVLTVLVESLRSVPRIEAAGMGAPRGRAIARDELRPHLVNVRVSDDELEAWRTEARADGFERVSGWVRALVGSLLGLVTPQEPLAVSPELAEIRRQLAGAMTNLSQLRALAASYGDESVGWADKTHSAVQTVLSRLYGPGR